MFKKFMKKVITTAFAATLMMSTVVTAQAAPIEVEVQDLFEADYYADKNPDVKTIFGNDSNALFNHFMMYGLKEGRPFSRAFDLEIYKKLNPDLENAFNNNWEMYLEHYIKHGISENRDGGGEFDIVTYAVSNPDVVNSLGWDFSAIKSHYYTFGKDEGRLAVPIRHRLINKTDITTSQTENHDTEEKIESKSDEYIELFEIYDIVPPERRPYFPIENFPCLGNIEKNIP